MTSRTIVFVANRTSGAWSSFADYVQRLAQPSTYPCALTQITRNALGVRGRWTRFLASLDSPVLTLTRDEFDRRYAKAATKAFPDGLAFPCALIDTAGSLTLAVSAPEITVTPDIEGLIDLVSERLVTK